MASYPRVQVKPFRGGLTDYVIAKIGLSEARHTSGPFIALAQPANGTLTRWPDPALVARVDALRDLLQPDPALVTAFVAMPDIEPTSPLTYGRHGPVCGYARHARTGALARVLMDAGAEKDDETKNGAPLYCAASHGDADAVRASLEAGAEVELTDAETPNETALRAAAAFGRPEIVDLVVAHGSKPRSVIEGAGIGDLSGYDLGELSDRERANALRAAARQRAAGDDRSASRRSDAGRR